MTGGSSLTSRRASSADDGRIVRETARLLPMIVARDLAPAQLDSVLGRTSPVLKLAIALVWLVGLATTNAWRHRSSLAASAVAAALTVGGCRRRPGAGGRAALAGGVRPRVLQHGVRGGERRPGVDHVAHAGAVAGHRRGGRGGRRARAAGGRDRRGRGGLRPDDRLDAAGRLRSSSRRTSRSGSPTARWPPTGRSRGSARTSRTSGGAPDPRLARLVAPADPRRPARARDPPRRPDGPGDGCSSFRVGNADRATGRYGGGGWTS